MSQEVLTGETVGLDSLFGALGNEYRLRILVSLYLADRGEQFRAEDLVGFDEDPAEVIPLLHHVHFPKLADLDLVEWDREEGAVRRGPAFRSIDRLFDCMAVRDEAMTDDLLRHEV